MAADHYLGEARLSSRQCFVRLAIAAILLVAVVSSASHWTITGRNTIERTVCMTRLQMIIVFCSFTRRWLHQSADDALCFHLPLILFAYFFSRQDILSFDAPKANSPILTAFLAHGRQLDYCRYVTLLRSAASRLPTDKLLDTRLQRSMQYCMRMRINFSHLEELCRISYPK